MKTQPKHICQAYLEFAQKECGRPAIDPTTFDLKNQAMWPNTRTSFFIRLHLCEGCWQVFADSKGGR